ncbi:hypothetical protein [Arthrobacter methylotrophus]|uniref:hypothetical protein n=1 Tax=Arthrobacter methylotrophus TaxID=121291 RepID=UPI0031EEA892
MAVSTSSASRAVSLQSAGPTVRACAGGSVRHPHREEVTAQHQEQRARRHAEAQE